MSRLTTKIKKSIQDEYSLGTMNVYNQLSSDGAILNKLGQLEDVLEEFGIESAEELRGQLNTLDDELFDLKHRNRILKDENMKLSGDAFRENFDRISKIWEFIKDNQTNSEYSDEICISKTKLHNFLNQIANGRSEDKLDKKDTEIIELNSNLMEENKQLKERLSEAIVPEYFNGDKAYAIIDTMTYRDVFPVK